MFAVLNKVWSAVQLSACSRSAPLQLSREKATTGKHGMIRSRRIAAAVTHRGGSYIAGRRSIIRPLHDAPGG